MIEEHGGAVGGAADLESVLRAFNHDLETLVREHVGQGRELAEDELRSIMAPPTDGAPEIVRTLYENVHTIVDRLLDANRKLSRLATRDPLTGAYNRAFFADALRIQVAEALRSGGHIMFVMVDIDRFKEVNDTRGHVIGDHLLREVARLLRTNVRASDLVIRYGGDEFLVVAPRLDAKACDLILDRLRRAERGSGREDLALSIGCWLWSPGDDVESAIRKADELMYEDKVSKALSMQRRPCTCS